MPLEPFQGVSVHRTEGINQSSVKFGDKSSICLYLFFSRSRTLPLRNLCCIMINKYYFLKYSPFKNMIFKINTYFNWENKRNMYDMLVSKRF